MISKCRRSEKYLKINIEHKIILYFAHTEFRTYIMPCNQPLDLGKRNAQFAFIKLNSWGVD
jgi:hypothetical protein